RATLRRDQGGRDGGAQWIAAHISGGERGPVPQYRRPGKETRAVGGECKGEPAGGGRVGGQTGKRRRGRVDRKGDGVGYGSSRILDGHGRATLRRDQVGRDGGGQVIGANISGGERGPVPQYRRPGKETRAVGGECKGGPAGGGRVGGQTGKRRRGRVDREGDGVGYGSSRILGGDGRASVRRDQVGRDGGAQLIAAHISGGERGPAPQYRRPGKETRAVGGECKGGPAGGGRVGGQTGKRRRGRVDREGDGVGYGSSRILGGDGRASVRRDQVGRDGGAQLIAAHISGGERGPAPQYRRPGKETRAVGGECKG